VNKIDKEAANPDRVMQELTEYELVPEAWGGDTIFVNISAKNNQGIDDLLEMILLVAEVEELKANPKANAFGTVIDAQLDKGRGS
ncbi:translation initiation factor IF-2, partial [Staphylococcus sp. SIMBA_130]